MCIFSGSVDSVSTTKILVSRVYQTEIVEQKGSKYKKPVGNPLQLVIYSNKVTLTPADSDSVRVGTAMILPFPLLKGQNRVALLDMSKYPNFFDDVELLFPIAEIPQSYEALSNSIADGYIDVMKVGNYKASIVPTYADFNRLQFNEFNLHPDVSSLLGQYYSKNFGFIVCILKPQAMYHPFAYVHELRSNGELFVPTRHFHGSSEDTLYSARVDRSAFGQFHDRLTTTDTRSDLMDEVGLKNNFYDTLMDDDDYMTHQIRRRGNRAKNAPAHGIDWDHDIYVINRPSALQGAFTRKPGVKVTLANPGRLSQVSNYINFKRMPVEVSFGEIGSLAKITIGKLYTDNHDLFL